MITVRTPDNNINERRYVLDIIFNNFLGLEYTLIHDQDTLCDDRWMIDLNNDHSLVFQDHFFSNYPQDLEYLKQESIPHVVKYVTNEFTLEKDIPVIYGSDKPVILSPSQLVCPIDIFASAFFMLSRWEEYVNPVRDDHLRFPASESIAYKHGFLGRPVVNEYVEMLKNMLLHFDNTINFKDHQFNLMLTHDVDIPIKYPNLRSHVKEVLRGKHLFKDMSQILKSILIQSRIYFGLKKDPYDTFDFLMDNSEKLGIKSHFFFMAEGETDFDNHYNCSDNIINKLASKIKTRGHLIGIHPTYNSYTDEARFKAEKSELEKKLSTKITVGRQHYLRFELPTTWQIWEDNDMDWDSSLGYPEQEGFRCGVCYEFPVFNILSREKLRLSEIPLIVMDSSFFTYQPRTTAEEMEQRIFEYMQTVSKYGGVFVLLWHNSSFDSPQSDFYQMYTRILQGFN